MLAGSNLRVGELTFKLVKKRRKEKEVEAGKERSL